MSSAAASAERKDTQLSRLRFIKSLRLDELRAFVTAHGAPGYRADQVFDWLYTRGAQSFDEMSNVPRALRETLAARFGRPDALTLDDELISGDGAVKRIFLLHDGARIESVSMPEDGRLTLCVSSQAGCAMDCAFCRTGSGGLNRGLECGEIIDQIAHVKRSGAHITNIVFMGMGEPLANFDQFAAALDILIHEKGFGISPRRITFSTVGLANRIRRAARELPPVNLAVSLNAPDDTLRSRLMPVNRKFPIAELLNACRAYARTSERPVTFEYVLIDKLNNSTAQAAKLAERIQSIPCKVNLIAFNPFEGCAFESPSPESVERFQAELTRRGIDAFVRRSRGRDIGAACGQLGNSSQQPAAISQGKAFKKTAKRK